MRTYRPPYSSDCKSRSQDREGKPSGLSRRYVRYRVRGLGFAMSTSVHRTVLTARFVRECSFRGSYSLTGWICPRLSSQDHSITACPTYKQ